MFEICDGNNIDLNIASPEDTMTPLMGAALDGVAEARDLVTPELLKRGVRVNDVDEEGYSALVYAVQRANSDTVRHLIAAGADPWILGDELFNQIGFGPMAKASSAKKGAEIAEAKVSIRQQLEQARKARPQEAKMAD